MDVGEAGHEKHALTCPLGPTSRTSHDGAVIEVWRAFRQLGLPASWEAANIAGDVRHAKRRCDVMVHLAHSTLVIDITRVHRPGLAPHQRRRLLAGGERSKRNAHPPLGHGKTLVPIVIDDLGGVGEAGMAAIRKIAGDAARMSGTRPKDALDLVLGSLLRGFHEASHRHAIRTGCEYTGPAGTDPDAPGADQDKRRCPGRPHPARRPRGGKGKRGRGRPAARGRGGRPRIPPAALPLPPPPPIQPVPLPPAVQQQQQQQPPPPPPRPLGASVHSSTQNSDVVVGSGSPHSVSSIATLGSWIAQRMSSSQSSVSPPLGACRA